MATKTTLTVEQYVALGEDPPGVRYELSDGELLVTPSSSSFHNEICDRLCAKLLDFLDKHPLGRVISEADVQLSESTVRRPDVAFVSKARLQGVDRRHTPLLAIPNVVIEIVSPTDRASDLMKKVSQYLKAGVQSVWLLYPDNLQACRYVTDVLKPESEIFSEVFSKERDFSEPELLPGFTLSLREIFSWADEA